MSLNILTVALNALSKCMSSSFQTLITYIGKIDHVKDAKSLKTFLDDEKYLLFQCGLTLLSETPTYSLLCVL